MGDYSALTKESELQETVRGIFSYYLPEIYVPPIHKVSYEPIRYKGDSYLDGLTMTYLQPPAGYTTQVHTLLGYHETDIDTIWGMRMSEPVSPTNPPRGFFASPYTLEDIWEEEGSSMTIERLAYTMGCAHRCMLDRRVLPIDLEWVWSGGRLCVIDFGLCDYGTVDPKKLLDDTSSTGLANDFYIPHKGDRGYEEFIEGYTKFPHV